MTPTFKLPAGYEARLLRFTLSRDGRGWKWYGRSDQGHLFPALNAKGTPLCGGDTFRTKHEAEIMATALDLPPYQIWNGRTGKYTGQSYSVIAYPA